MHLILAALVAFGILTLWVPALWPVTVFQVGLFALSTLAVWRFQGRPPRFVFPLIPPMVGVAWGGFQMAAGLTEYPFETQRAVVQWATFLAMVVVALCVFRDDRVRTWFRSAMVWFAFLVAVIATLQTFTSAGKVFWLFPTEYTDFVMGPILSRNHYAAFVEVVLPVALYEALRKGGRSLLYSVVAGALFASVIAAGSRAGAILATAETLTVAILLRGWSGRKIAGVATLRIAVFLAVFTAVVGHRVVWDRLWEADPLAGRQEYAAASLRMIAEHPWFGVGLGVWPAAYPRYATSDAGTFVNQAHDDWLQWTAEGGVLFGVAMFTLLVWCVPYGLRSVWGIGVVAVLLHAFVDYPFSRPALGSWIFLMVGLLAADRESCALRDRPDQTATRPEPAMTGAGIAAI